VRKAGRTKRSGDKCNIYIPNPSRRMKQTFAGFGKALPSPKKTIFGGNPFGNIKNKVKRGMTKIGNKMGFTHGEGDGFSYMIEAHKARSKWKQQEAMGKDELIRSFVTSVVVLGAIKVIRAKQREYVPAFSDKKPWNGERRRGESIEVEDDTTPPVSSSDNVGDGKLTLPPLEVDAPDSTASLSNLYRTASFSPVHSIRGEESEFSFNRSEIEGQENFWSVVGRVFRPNKSKEVEEKEIILEKEVPKVEQVFVEKRIGFTWVERRTWLDEAIKISNDNYGGGDGGVGGPVPNLIKDVKVCRPDLLDDKRKEGLSWSGKRIESARKFDKRIMNADNVLKEIKGKLFK
jgi:hypothetical protein